MKQLQKFWFKPPYQRKDKPVVEFELLPLNQRAYITLKSELRLSRGGRVLPTAEGVLSTFAYAVNNWRGHETPFSLEAKEEVIEGLASPEWSLWQAEIASELLRRALIGEPEAKNS